MAATIASLVALGLSRQRRRSVDATASQVDIDAALVLLGGIVETQLLAQLLNPRLQLLDMASRVIPLADNDMQMRLAGGLGIADALLEDVLGLLDKLAVEVDGVLGDAAGRVVLAEDEFGGLLVVLGLLPLVALACEKRSAQLGLGCPERGTACLPQRAPWQQHRRRVHMLRATVPSGSAAVSMEYQGYATPGNYTRSKHDLFMSPSRRARSRSRSYSASTSALVL
jgi:hypothetical protein